MLKKLLYSVFALTVLTLVAVVVLIWNVDRLVDGFRPSISNAVSTALGRPVTFGALSVGLLPSTKIRIEQLVVGDAKNPDAKLSAVNLHTSLAGILRGALVAHSIVLEEPQLTAIRMPDGKLFVGGMLLSNRSASQTPKSPGDKTTFVEHTTDSDGSKDQPPVAKQHSVSFEIDELTINNGMVVVEDRLKLPGRQFSLKELNGSARDIKSSGTARIQISTSAYASELLVGPPGGDSSLVVPEQNQIGSAQLSGIVGDYRSGEPLDLTGKLTVTNFGLVTKILHQLSSKLEPLQVSEGSEIGFTVKNEGQNLKFSTDSDLTPIAISFQQNVSKAKGTPLNLKLLGNTDTGTNSSITFSIELDKSKIAGDIVVTTPPSQQPQISLKLFDTTLILDELGQLLPSIQKFNVKGTAIPELTGKASPSNIPRTIYSEGTIKLILVSASVPQEKSTDPLTLDKLNGVAKMAGRSASADPLAFEVAGIPLTASASIGSFENGDLNFKVTADDIDLTKLAKAANMPQLNNGSANGLIVNGVCGIWDTVCGANVTLARVSVLGNELGNLQAKIDHRKSLTAISDLSVDVFGGNIRGKLSVAGSRVSTDISAEQLELARLFQFGAPSAKISLTGPLQNVKTAVTLDRNNPSSSLSGPLSLVAGPGQIRGFNLLKETLGKIGSIPGITGTLSSFIPEQFRPILNQEGTAFDRLVLECLAKDGTINTNNIALSHSLYSVVGHGWFSLRDSMQFNAQFRLSPLLTQAMVAKQQRLKLLTEKNGELVIPIVVTQDGGSTVVVPDIKDLLQRAASSGVKEAATKALDKVSPGLGKAGKLLEGFFDR